MNILALLAIGVLMGGIAAYIAEKKGRSHTEGFLLGFFFGFFGILLELFFPKREKED